MRTVAIVMLLAACAGDDGKDADTGADADTDTDSDADSDADTDSDTDSDADTDTDPPATASITGVVTTRGGPLASADLRFCRGQLCRNGTTDASGGFAFEEVPSDWHSLEVAAQPSSGLATVLVPLNFADGEARTVELVALPLDPSSPLGDTPTEHALGEGLFATFGAADIEPPLFVDPATSAAGVRLPEDAWVPTDEVAGTVLAMWYTAPFDHHALTGLPVRITNDFGLADGTELRVLVASYEESRWLDAGTATVSGADIVGASLPLLSTVILVQP